MIEELAYIIDRLSSRKHILDSVEIHVFGSALNRDLLYSDVDILVVYRTMRDLEQVRNLLSELDPYFPLDVIFMDPQEESEFDFIKEQRCIRLNP